MYSTFWKGTVEHAMLPQIRWYGKHQTHVGRSKGDNTSRTITRTTKPNGTVKEQLRARYNRNQDMDVEHAHQTQFNFYMCGHMLEAEQLPHTATTTADEAWDMHNGVIGKKGMKM